MSAPPKHSRTIRITSIVVLLLLLPANFIIASVRDRAPTVPDVSAAGAGSGASPSPHPSTPTPMPTPSHPITQTTTPRPTASPTAGPRVLRSAGCDTKADFNADGFADLAVGTPREDVGSYRDSGVVSVMYGRSSGLSSSHSQFWSQDSPGVHDTNENGDMFGSALATGDFNGDGYSDLAVGVPHESLSINGVGAVNILFGSAHGLRGTGSQFFTEDTPGMNETGGLLDQFGSALSAGDYNADGFADLAVGMPFKDVPGIGIAGAFAILYGSSAGLSTTGNQFFSQNTDQIPGDSNPNDEFGAQVASGDFNGDVFCDLAVSAPREDLNGKTDAGQVTVLYGSLTGIAGAGAQLWSQDSPNIADQIEASDEFGLVLAAGNLNGDRYADLVVGVPFEDRGTVGDSGAVHVIFGNARGLTARNNQEWTQDRSGVPDSAEAGDVFGSSLAIADFNGDHINDLAIGVPYESLESALGNRPNAGAVNVLYSNRSGPTTTGAQFYTQDSPGIADTAEEGDVFAWALAAGDFDHNGASDLAITASHESIGSKNDAGAFHVLYAQRPAGLRGAGSQFWSQDSTGIADDAEIDDAFGSAASG